MYYITISEDGFGFKVPDIHIITSEDKYISDEIYDRFFTEQSQGKSFKIKDINGTTFEEIFEEYQLEDNNPEEQPMPEIEELKQRIKQLEELVLSFKKVNDDVLVLDSGAVDSIQSTQND